MDNDILDLKYNSNSRKCSIKKSMYYIKVNKRLRKG